MTPKPLQIDCGTFALIGIVDHQLLEELPIESGMNFV